MIKNDCRRMETASDCSALLSKRVTSISCLFSITVSCASCHTIAVPVTLLNFPIFFSKRGMFGSIISTSFPGSVILPGNEVALTSIICVTGMRRTCILQIWNSYRWILALCFQYLSLFGFPLEYKLNMLRWPWMAYTSFLLSLESYSCSLTECLELFTEPETLSENDAW